MPRRDGETEPRPLWNTPLNRTPMEKSSMSQPSAGASPPHQPSEHPASYPAAGPGGEPPPPVRTAVRLMWVGAALTLLVVLLVPAQLDATLEQVAEESGPGVANDAAFNSAIAGAVVMGLVLVAVWVLMAVMNRKGKTWARITATVLAGVNILSMLSAIIGATGATATPLALIPSVISLVLAAVIVYLLWQRPSSEWFDAMGRRSASPA